AHHQGEDGVRLLARDLAHLQQARGVQAGEHAVRLRDRPFEHLEQLGARPRPPLGELRRPVAPVVGSAEDVAQEMPGGPADVPDEVSDGVGLLGRARPELGLVQAREAVAHLAREPVDEAPPRVLQHGRAQRVRVAAYRPIHSMPAIAYLLISGSYLRKSAMFAGGTSSALARSFSSAARCFAAPAFFCISSSIFVVASICWRCSGVSLDWSAALSLSAASPEWAMVSAVWS